MKVLGFLLGLGVAAYFQVFGLRAFPTPTQFVDPFLVVVLMAALGAQTGTPALLAGTAGGLARDALTGGRLGLHGFAFTLAAWILQALRQRFVIQTSFQVAALFSLIAAMEQTILALLEVTLVARPELPDIGSMVGIIVTTGIFGGGLHEASGRLGIWARARSERRRRRLGLETQP